ncbi:MAG: low specificity L-threonine aldolase [Parvibaculaceae bacterium]|nr:low specificity L-threonine aldolase [Parvibaculaceae bacterium]HBM89523.1 low specificity L-threonine aldolase [Rhodobiaceae bacterium]|tara:strand:- start:620 stop:1654 length:1035 start_codon:yes stop_codon:yes gene_type:complete
MKFASDNGSGVAPEIMSALGAANEGAAPGYGADDFTQEACDRLSEVFERDVSAFLVATGTAANALNLAVITEPHGAVFVHERAHVHTDECGASEFYMHGAKLLPLAGEHGKLSAAAIKQGLEGFAQGIVHHPQAQAISLSQVTESGTVYSVAEIEALSALAKDHSLRVHMDGARFANALVSLGCSPAEMTWKAGVDVLSFGATKNGAMGVEAVVIFDEGLAANFPFLRKRSGQLMSKGRFLGAQMSAYLKDGLWLAMAAHANKMASLLASGIERLPAARLRHPVQANQVFAVLPKPAHKALIAAGAAYYPWEREPDGIAVRLVTSFSTSEEEVDAFLSIAGGAL